MYVYFVWLIYKLYLTHLHTAVPVPFASVTPPTITADPRPFPLGTIVPVIVVVLGIVTAVVITGE